MIWPSISNLNRYLWLQGPNATFPGLDKVQCLLKWTRFDYHQQPSRVSISQFHRRSSFPLSLLANSFPRLFATRTCWGDAASTGAWSTSQNLPPKLSDSENEIKKKNGEQVPPDRKWRGSQARGRDETGSGEQGKGRPSAHRHGFRAMPRSRTLKPLTWIGKRGVE